MSTFNGLIAEFPEIRVDFFRSYPDLSPPLACFLSHIHSDHLAGLENLRSPFVYCSAATREMLLRLERYPCRINYANGILEARVQRYRHLKKLLKPLPLDTPTVLELAPGNILQVTLFNANHCPGAVMFLLEGQGKAVLYSGDIRSEPWFVNSVARSPALVEYSSGLKTLDTIYLDTSFIDNVSFPTKSDGIRELLQKVSRYPADTIFHFQAWTYGYEDVWIALSKALGSKIHVDEYKMAMFRSLLVAHSDTPFAATLHLSPEAPALVGFMCGNTHHAGCLTLDETVRIHSCEKGSYCQTIQNSPVVWIRPIITRLPGGQDVAEAGIGGGGEDLEREAELDYLSPLDVEDFLEALFDTDGATNALHEQIRRLLVSAVTSGRKVPLDLERSAFGENNEAELANALQAITNKIKLRDNQLSGETPAREALPNVITFPYSRHSSYPELCDLVEAFKPRDVWPCTVDIPRWLHEGITIEHLFSRHCSGDQFRHDNLMRERFPDHENAGGGNAESQATTTSARSFLRVSPHPMDDCFQPLPTSNLASEIQPVLDPVSGSQNPNLEVSGDYGRCSQPPQCAEDSALLEEFEPSNLQNSQDSTMSDMALEARLQAFQAILEHAKGKASMEIGLLSTRDNHSSLDEELAYMKP